MAVDVVRGDGRSGLVRGQDHGLRHLHDGGLGIVGDVGVRARRRVRPGGTPGSTILAATVAGRQRTVIVHIPRGYSGSSKVPLVLNKHGSGVTAADQEAFTGVDATADREGFVVAYPQGLIPSGSGFDWNVPGVPLVGDKAVPAGAADDVAARTEYEVIRLELLDGSGDVSG